MYPSYKITNMTASMQLSRQLDLEQEIANSLGLIKRTNREKHGSKNRGFTSVKFSVPISSLKKVTALVYKSGKCILVGASSFEDIFEACYNVTTWFGDCEITFARVTNIAATMTANHKLKLDDLYYQIRQGDKCQLVAENEPELFPALVANLKDTKMKAILFSTGKIILTGARNIGQLDQLQNEIINLLPENF